MVLSILMAALELRSAVMMPNTVDQGPLCVLGLPVLTATIRLTRGQRKFTTKV